ncbi:MAG: long-chain-fatty-acid--CoA ligase [Desulfobacteraceae bacterium]|nr:long-chain-fatty-acid--CoA ligase [Desulfobacteraceae bacterium]
MYTLGDIPRKTALSYPDREAIFFEGTRLTYKEFNHRINRLANALTDKGFKDKDRLAVLTDNTFKFLEVYFAAAKLGMSVTPLNTRLSNDEIIFIVNDSESSCLFVGEGYEKKGVEILKALPGVRECILLDDKVEGFIDYQEMKVNGFTNYEDMLNTASETEPTTVVDEEEMAILMYTGGTTGLPKGVMMSHRGIMTAIIAANLSSSFTKDDTTCFVLPLFHVSFWPALAVLMVGGKVAINRKPALENILKLIQDEKCTHINAVPTIYGWLLQIEDIDTYDLSSLRSVSYAGSPFPTEILKQCLQKFGNILSQGYGMTEACGVTRLSEEDHVLDGEKSELLTSAGKPSICAEVKIFDKQDNEMKIGEIGEIAVRGKHVMMGYWKNPELTRKALRGGWYHTGDMGYMDEKDYLFLVDRKADMIVTGGENVYPKEVENVLYTHPAVAMAAVVSAPDKKWGERVQAVVVLKENQSATEEEIIEFCKRKLAGYKCPKSITFENTLPTTPVGKILRKDLKKKFWEGQERSIG